MIPIKDVIHYKRSGALHIPYKINMEWIVKIPTEVNRLSRGTGSIGLKMTQRYELKKKKGVVFVDNTLKSYVFVPKEIMFQYESVGKSCNGVKDTIFSWDLKKILEDHKLELVKIPQEDGYLAPHETGASGDIRRKFGL